MVYRDRLGSLVGEYKLINSLGSGGFGEVYLAEHGHTNKQVAIKLLHARLSNKTELHEFLNEARTIRLNHPHILQLLDFGITDDEIPFLVMEYAPNGTLRQRYPRATRVPLPTVVEHIHALASALQYAHDQRLVHRDVKPENILLGANDVLLLSDFGIATVAHSSFSLTSTGAEGTLPYMAPEQIQGKPRPASDQYALAIITYEWLTGSRPFTGTPIELIGQHISASPTSLRNLLPDLSIEVDQVVLTALAKDPKARFATVQAFASAFRDAAQLIYTSNISPSTPVNNESISTTIHTGMKTYSPYNAPIEFTLLAESTSGKASQTNTAPSKYTKAFGILPIKRFGNASIQGLQNRHLSFFSLFLVFITALGITFASIAINIDPVHKIIKNRNIGERQVILAPTPTPITFSLGWPIVEDYMIDENADDTTVHTFTVTASRKNSRFVPLPIAGISGKIWLINSPRSPQRYLTFTTAIIQNRLEHPETLINPITAQDDEGVDYPEKPFLLFSAKTPQLSITDAQGKITWAYQISAKVPAGVYCLMILMDYRGQTFNWEWLVINIMKQ